MTHFIEAGKRWFGLGGNDAAPAREPTAVPDFSPYDFSQVRLDSLRRWLTDFQQGVVMAEGKRWPISFKSIDYRVFQPLGFSQVTVKKFLETVCQLGFCEPVHFYDRISSGQLVDAVGFDQHRMLSFAALVKMYAELAPQFGANLSVSPQDRVGRVAYATKGLLASYPQLVALIGDSPHQSLPPEELRVGIEVPDDTIRDEGGKRIYRFGGPKRSVEPASQEPVTTLSNLLEGIRDDRLGAFMVEVQSMMNGKVSVRVSDIPTWPEFQGKVGLSQTIIRRLLGEILVADLAVMNSPKAPATQVNRYNPPSVFDEPRVLVFAALCRELKEKAQRGRYGVLTWEDVVRTMKRKLGSSALAGFVGGNVKTERPIWHVKQLQDILAAIVQASVRNSRTNSPSAKRHLMHHSPSAATSGLVVPRDNSSSGLVKEGAVSHPADQPVKDYLLGVDEAKVWAILAHLSWDTREPVNMADIGKLGLTTEQVAGIMRASVKHHGQGGGSHFNPDASLTHARLRNALELSLRDLEKRRGGRGF